MSHRSVHLRVAKHFLLLLLASAATAQTYLFNRAEFFAGKVPNAVAVGDFNNDGKLDLAIANKTDNTVSILLGQTNGTFGAHTDFADLVAPGEQGFVGRRHLRGGEF